MLERSDLVAHLKKDTTIGGINVYDQLTEVTSQLAQKASIEALNLKADKTYVDNELSKKAPVDALDLKANKTDVEQKADKTYVDNELSKKADTSYVNTQLSTKRDRSEKIKGSDLDTSSDDVKIKLVNLATEVRQAIAGTAPVTTEPPAGGVNETHLADNSVTLDKLAISPYSDPFVDNTPNADSFSFRFLEGKAIEVYFPQYVIWYYPDRTGQSISFPITPGNITIPNWAALVLDLDDGQLKVVLDKQPRPKNYLLMCMNSDGKLEGGYLWRKYVDKRFIIMENRLENLESDKLPDYWTNYVRNKYLTIQALQDNDGANRFSFGFITDTHFPDNANNSGKLIDYMIDKLNISYIIHGGDAYNNGTTTTKETAKSRIETMWNVFKNTKDKMLYTLGNHDDNSITQKWVETLKEGELYSQFFRYLGNRVVMGESGKYYYADDNFHKVRYIVLDSIDIPYIQNDTDLIYRGQWDYAFRQQQLEWLANVALDVPSREWSVILCSHIPPYDQGVTGFDIGIKNAEIARGIVHAFKNKTTYTGISLESVEPDFKVNISVDFTNKGGNVICWLSGHVHYDNIVTMPEGIKLVTTINDALTPWSDAPSKTKGTTTEHAFDVFTVDKANRFVYVTRIGAGEDRQFGY